VRALNTEVALLKVGPVATPSLPGDLAGVVLEGTGVGHVPSAYHQQVHEFISTGRPVVIASRCRNDRRESPPDGVLLAGDLTAEKAAIALMAALGSTSDPDEIRMWWAELQAPH
jgi:L-asparaginase